MQIALLHDHYDDAHLDAVKSEMLKMGAPVIKAVWMDCYDCYAALEGCHRIRAAKSLGIVPVIDAIDYDDVCDVEAVNGNLGLDLDNPGTTYGEILDNSHRQTIITF